MFCRNLVPGTYLPNAKGNSPQGENKGKLVMIKHKSSWMKSKSLLQSRVCVSPRTLTSFFPIITRAFFQAKHTL